VRRHALIVLLLAVLPHLGALRGEFLQDDFTVIVRSPIVTGERPLWEAFTTDYWHFFSADTPGLYRPLPVFAFGLEWRLWGGHSALFRAMNLLFHAGTSLLVLLLLRRVTGDAATALAAAALFAVHPIHAEAICPAVGRLELFAALGAAGAVWLHLRDYRLPRIPRPLSMTLALLAAAGAMLSKESAVCIPGLMTVADLCRREGRGLNLSRLAMIAAAIGVAGAVLLLRLAVLGQQPPLGRSQTLFVSNPLIALAPLGRIGVALRILGYDLWLLVMPWRPLGDYSHNTFDIARTWNHPGTAASIVVLAALLVAAIRCWRTRPEVTFAAGWFAVSIFIVSNAAFTTGTIFAERLLYLPSAGVCLGLALALRAVAGSLRAFAAAASALVILFAGRSAVRVADFRSEAPLFTASWRANPNSAATAYHLGNLARLSGDLASAREWFQAALAIRPEYAAVRPALILTLRDLGDEPAALQVARASVQTDSETAAIAWLWADVALSLDRPAEALDVLTRALQRWPDQAQGHLLLGDAHRALHHHEAALDAYARSLELDPNQPITWIQRGGLQREMRLLDEALASLDHAIALAPEMGVAHRCRAEVLWQLGRRDEARAALAEARRLLPGDPAVVRLERRWRNP
jgi:protein O-mannosyl-transferase